MRISIITATYNSEKTLLATLLSLEKQTHSDIEYIVVDGASKDNTIELIKSKCTRVSTIICEPDNGIYDALNKGIQAASGDIIGFLHSDDLLAYDDAIAEQYVKMSHEPEALCEAIYAHDQKDRLKVRRQRKRTNDLLDKMQDQIIYPKLDDEKKKEIES